MSFIVTKINCSSGMTESSSSSFTIDSDWGLFSNGGDDDGNISIEEMCDTTEVFLFLDEFSSNGRYIQNKRQQCKQENDNSNDEFIKLEDLYDSDSTSTQLSDTSSETFLQSSVTLSPRFPDYDQLQNLPNEIVERPKCLLAFTSNS